jgi:hypothetical protein
MKRRMTAIWRGLAIACLATAGLVATARAERAAGLVDENLLALFDTAAPGTLTVRSVTGLGAGESLVGIDVRPATGELYALSVASESVNNSIVATYRLDPDTAVATFIGATSPLPGAGDVATGIDFNPTVDRIRLVNTNDENARVNPFSGNLAGDDPNINPPAADVIAAAYDRNVAPTQPSPPISTLTTLYVINRATSSLALQGGVDGTPSANSGIISDVGPLGITLNANRDAGFDITPEGVAYASLTSGGVTRLYWINVGTGAAALIGELPLELRSLAILPDTAAPIVRLKSGGSANLRALRSRGVVFRFTSDEAVSVKATLTAHWRGRRVTMARGESSLVAAGTGRVRVKPTAAGRRIAEKLLDSDRRRTAAMLEFVAVDSSGNSATVRKRIVLRA